MFPFFIMKKDSKTIIIDITAEVLGNLLLSFATYNIAASENFAVSGFSGLALIFYKLFQFPMGTSIFLMNIPFALLCAKFISWRFLAKSIRCIIIQSLMMNYLVVLLPVVHMEGILSAIVVGVLFGVGYAIIYMRGSSTGGIDFMTMLVKHWNPHMNTGTISFIFDFLSLFLYGLIFKSLEPVIYGLIIVFISATTIDRITLGLNQGAVALIVTDKGNGKNICKIVDEICQRGSTILDGTGGYSSDDKDMVMVAGSSKDIYNIQSAMKRHAPESFIIVLNSKEVQGEGFLIHRASGDEK